MTSEDILDSYFNVKNTYVEILKKVGISLIVDIETENSLINTMEINYCEHWNKTIASLNNDILIIVFKGIVVVEKHFQWKHCSAATGVYMYKEIQKRKLDMNLELANWSFLYSDNSYIPFGSAGNIRFKSRNAFDYVRNTSGLELLNKGYLDFKEIEKFVKYRWDITEEALEKVLDRNSYIEDLLIKELNQKYHSLLLKLKKMEEEINKNKR
ncbi:MAG: hypothetical protein KBC58_00435 [Flavobacterium sp.]|nr:hypothetical protein [Flavobacterium sp.]